MFGKYLNGEFMPEEDLIDLGDSATQEEKDNKVEKRIKSLSEKTRLASEERDAEKARADKLEVDRQVALKDAEFYKTFNTSAAKYQGATEYQDQIREKVMAGYDMEDAMVAVLNKEGQFVPPPPSKGDSPIGGSAPTNPTKGNKSVQEMSVDEKREVLKDNLNLSL